MEKQFFPAIATNNTGGKSTFQELQSYIDKQLETILKSPIYRGRTGNNLEITDIEHFNSVQLKNIQITNKDVQCYTKSLLYKKAYIEDFLTDTGFFSATTIKEFWSGNEFNLGIKNSALYLTTNLDENDIPIASVADPILLYDNDNSISYILYIIEREDKPYPVCEYHLANIGNTVDRDGKTWTRIAVQKCQGKDKEKVSTQVYAADMKGPRGDAAQGANYKLGTGISFFKNIYPTKDEKVPYHIWDEIHRPVVYERYTSTDGDVITKADEPSERARYILDLKMLDFGKNPNQEAGYKICQWEDFVVDLLRCNIKLTDGNKIDIPNAGTPSYTRLFPTEEVVTYTDMSTTTDIMDEMYKILKDLDMSLWGYVDEEDFLEPDHIGPSQYKCILYNDVLLYDEDPVLDRCSFFNYNNGIFKTAWHAYHRLMEFDGLGDNDSYKLNKEDKYASYSVALNACWDIVDSIYEGRGGVVKTTCYDIMEDGVDPFAKSEDDDEYGIPYPIKDRFDPVKFHMQGGKNNSYLCVEFVKVKINTGEFEVESRKDISLKTSGEINLRSRCVKPSGFNQVLGYGKGDDPSGYGHGEHIFGMTPEMLFTWMHGEGDFVLTENPNPKWLNCVGYGADDETLEECWELVEVASDCAISLNSNSNILGEVAGDSNAMMNYVKQTIPPLYFGQAYWGGNNSSDNKADKISNGSIYYNNNEGGNLYIFDHTLAADYWGEGVKDKKGIWEDGGWGLKSNSSIQSGWKREHLIYVEKRTSDNTKNKMRIYSYPGGFPTPNAANFSFISSTRLGYMPAKDKKIGWVDGGGQIMSYEDCTKISEVEIKDENSTSDITYKFQSPIDFTSGSVSCIKEVITENGSTGERQSTTTTVTLDKKAFAEIFVGNFAIIPVDTSLSDPYKTKLDSDNILWFNTGKCYYTTIERWPSSLIVQRKLDDGKKFSNRQYLLLSLQTMRAYNKSVDDFHYSTKKLTLDKNYQYFPAKVNSTVNNMISRYHVRGFRRTSIQPLFLCEDDNRLYKLLINLSPKTVSHMYVPDYDLATKTYKKTTISEPLWENATLDDISYKCIPSLPPGEEPDWQSEIEVEWHRQDDADEGTRWTSTDIQCTGIVADPGDDGENYENIILDVKVKRQVKTSSGVSDVWGKGTYYVYLKPKMSEWIAVKAFIKGNWANNPERTRQLLSSGYTQDDVDRYQTWTNVILAIKQQTNYKGAHFTTDGRNWNNKPSGATLTKVKEIVNWFKQDPNYGKRWRWVTLILEAAIKFVDDADPAEVTHSQINYNLTDGNGANVWQALYYASRWLVATADIS